MNTINYDLSNKIVVKIIEVKYFDNGDKVSIPKKMHEYQTMSYGNDLIYDTSDKKIIKTNYIHYFNNGDIITLDHEYKKKEIFVRNRRQKFSKYKV